MSLTRSLTALGIGVPVALCLSLPGQVISAHARDATLPSNIALDDALVDAVSTMFRASQTFRTQCERVRMHSNVRVRVEFAFPSAEGQSLRAHCHLQRYEYGRVNAHVRIWRRDGVAELIAHELEHVLEFAEGVNYRALALIDPGSVWAATASAFETRRAVTTGGRVAREVAASLARNRLRERADEHAARSPR
jgi:hypothetical protein